MHKPFSSFEDSGSKAASILAVGSALPRTVMSLEQVAARHNVRPEILHPLGFEELRVAMFDDEHPSDLAARALAAALKALGASKEDVGLVISTGLSRDHPIPWLVSMELITRLGMGGAFGFDLIEGCAGVVTALSIARDYVMVEGRRPLAAIVAAERWIFHGPPEISRPVLYSAGDGASVCLVGRGAKCEIGRLASYTEPRLVNTVYIPAGGTREPLTSAALRENRHMVHWKTDVPPLDFMDTYVSGYSTALNAALESLPPEERVMKLMLMNQFEESQHQRVVRRLRLSESQLVRTYIKLGHVGAADVMLALEQVSRTGRLQKGTVIVSASTQGSYVALPLRVTDPRGIAIPAADPAS